MIPDTTTSQPTFDELNLIAPVLKALNDLGYEVPSPIQSKIIPFVSAGRDVVGQAQTGTGKTAAFALPLLSKIDLKKLVPQVLVLTPTRELAIQVAEAFHRYAAYMQGFHVVPIYGGQDYQTQLKQLKRGVHVVVGTPGRVMDHMNRGTLKLDALNCLVLDEADEMLRMGFIDDVEWILEKTPSQRQIALFSATMPDAIRRIAKKHLKDPEQVTIKVRTSTAETIRQRYWMVSGVHKLDALTRILEAESFEGVIIFVHTKTATLELAEKLAARGYASAALNGDIPQNQRIRTVERLKSGDLDIVVATDVAARGLDVQRISHVINYDIPHDTESYVHRIGRTGRAGRSGEAILFVAPRETRMLSAIEKATRQKIDMMELPSTEVINDKRVSRFFQRITDTLAANTRELQFFSQLLDKYQHEHNIPAVEVAAALATLLQGSTPLILKPKAEAEFRPSVQAPGRDRARNSERRSPSMQAPGRDRARSSERSSPSMQELGRDRTRSSERPSSKHKIKETMDRYRIEVGREHGVKPGNIVGAIANEAGLNSKHIGQIEIFATHSLIELPQDMSPEILKDLKDVWVANQQLKISKATVHVRSREKSFAKAKSYKGKHKS